LKKEPGKLMFLVVVALRRKPKDTMKKVVRFVDIGIKVILDKGKLNVGCVNKFIRRTKMKRIIISWLLVIGVVMLGMSFPFNGKFDAMDFVMGFIAGGIGIVLGMWENRRII